VVDECGVLTVTAGSEVGDAQRSPVAPLHVVLGYRNDLVIYGFTKRLGVETEEAQRIFVETLRWLWYVASTEPTAENPEAHAIDGPLAILDEMWHEFILVTRDYTEFCNSMFGRYIHHEPESPNGSQSKPNEPADVKPALAALLARKRAKYEAVYDCLGKDVFLRWYREFPQKYDSDAISLLRQSQR
jgi:hypothetical protein